MPKVIFTPNLQCHLVDPRGRYDGATVKEALDDVFETETVLRGHVLDERGRLLPKVVVFINGRPLQDRLRLSDPVREQSEIWVMQT